MTNLEYIENLKKVFVGTRMDEFLEDSEKIAVKMLELQGVKYKHFCLTNVEAMSHKYITIEGLGSLSDSDEDVTVHIPLKYYEKNAVIKLEDFYIL